MIGRRSERIKSQQSGKLCFPSCPCLKWDVAQRGGCSIHHVAVSCPLTRTSPPYAVTSVSALQPPGNFRENT